MELIPAKFGFAIKTHTFKWHSCNRMSMFLALEWGKVVPSHFRILPSKLRKYMTIELK